MSDNITNEEDPSYGGMAGVVVVSGRPYAVGLAWESCDRNNKPFLFAKTTAKERGDDLYCLREPSRDQFGLGRSEHRHKAGMASLAATLAESEGTSFIGAFRVPDGWYLAAVGGEDKILAGYDAVFADEEEAKTHFGDIFFQRQWPASYAPADWGFDEARPTNLDDLLTVRKPRTKLRAVSNTKLILKVAGFIVAAGLFFGGGRLLLDWYNSPGPKAPPPPPPEAPPIFVPPIPTEGRAIGLNMLDACVNGILAAPTNAAGWSAKTVSCVIAPPPDKIDPRKTLLDYPLDVSIEVSFAREGGTINWIGASLNSPTLRPVVNESPSGAVASWTLPGVNGLPRYTPDADLDDVAVGRRFLISNFEEAFSPITIKDPTTKKFSAQVASQAPGRFQSKQIDYEKSLDFSFTTHQDPRDFAPILSHFKALVVTSVKLDPVSWTWTVDAADYERLPLPGEIARQVQRGKAQKASSAAKPAPDAVPTQAR